MNIIINPTNHNTQISQSLTAEQLTQLITLHFRAIEPQDCDLLTTVFQHSVEVLFGKGQIPSLVSPPIDVDATTLFAAEQAYTNDLAAQYKKQICKQLAFNVVVFKPAKQATTRQLLLTSSLSIYLVLDIYRDSISQSINNPQCNAYITHWVASIMAVLFANALPATLTEALTAAQGFELSIDYMGTMALQNQNPQGEYD